MTLLTAKQLAKAQPWQLREHLLTLDAATMSRALRGMSPQGARRLNRAWPFWARPEQLAPAGNWRFWLLLAGRGYGKALALDTPIPTPSGWTTMGAIKVGDEVFAEDGTPTQVMFATDVQHGRRCFRVVFDDHSEIIADAEHRWLTTDKAARRTRSDNKAKSRVRTTDEIAATLRAGKERNHSIACAKPLALPEIALPVPAYTFGFWLGDGDSAGAVITCGNDDATEIRALIEADGVKCGETKRDPRSNAQRWSIGVREKSRSTTTGRMQSNGSVHSALSSLGVLKAKRIPTVYARASASQRMALLQGLMDSDGSASPSGHVELTLTDEGLANDAFDLVCSLGFKATITESSAKLNSVEVSRRWRILWTPRVPVFRLARKLARCTTSSRQQRGRTAARFIVDVIPIDSVPVRCITVAAKSHLYLCGKSMIPTHNTRSGAEWIHQRVRDGRARYIAFGAPTASDARDIMVQGPSGILATADPRGRPYFEPSKRLITFPGGATATLFTSEKPDAGRGPEHDTVWLEELASWQHLDDANSLFTNLDLGLRRSGPDGGRPCGIITTTPKPRDMIKKLVADAMVKVTRGRTHDNRENLDEAYFERMRRVYEGTRQGRQELDAEILDDVEGAMWTSAIIDAVRVDKAPELQRILVGVDPAATSNTNSDETGIIVAGLGVDGFVYVLDDVTCVMRPRGWGTRALQAVDDHSADGIVVEVNNGGEMVEETILNIDPLANVISVHASRGKRARAEPIAALYESTRARPSIIRHVGTHAKLEKQMTSYTGASTDKSPDRLDALVWVCTALLKDSGALAFS